jgi:DNA-binding response OmpR family regulator
MIAIVSSAARERAALTALCESRDWPTLECDSVRAMAHRVFRSAPRIILVRHKLVDGYSDDVLAHLRAADRGADTKVIVLIGAGTASSVEARQLALGADCVQRDPVRIDVLLAYLDKYYTQPRRETAAPKPGAGSLSFAGAKVCAAERTLSVGVKSVQLTPREMALVEMFAQSHGEVLTYETLYTEILGRRFRGDTSIMRVLLGRLGTKAGSLGIPLRRWIAVIPKTGYRYDAARISTARLRKKSGPTLLTAA